MVRINAAANNKLNFNQGNREDDLSKDDQDSQVDDDREDDFSLLLDSIDDDDSGSEIEVMEEPLLPKFLFKIKEENKLTQKCLKKIASATKQLFQGSIRKLKRKAWLDSHEIPSFEKSFEDEIDDYTTSWLPTWRIFTRETIAVSLLL